METVNSSSVSARHNSTLLLGPVV